MAADGRDYVADFELPEAQPQPATMIVCGSVT
jgi:hypothetical protein